MPLIPLSPPIPHDRPERAATQVTDTALAPEQQTATMEQGFASLNKYFLENEYALQNVLLQRRTQKNLDRRIISEVGFRELGAAGLPATGAVPVFQYVPPKPQGITKRPEGSVPTVFVMHSFGGGFDLSKLKNQSVKSVAVDPATGFNPARYFNGVRELAVNDSVKAIHHVISRRGDLTNSAPWDVTAYHGGGSNSHLLGPKLDGINQVSIGIELEEYYIRHSDEKVLTAIVNRVPYTDQQYTIIAFLLKKYIGWTGNYDILKWLGPTDQTIRNVQAGLKGCTTHSVFNPAHADPSAEFLLPQGFTKNSPIPAHLADNAAQWRKRFGLFWRDVGNDYPLSAWDHIFAKVAKIRAFNLNTEIFDTSFVNQRIILETPEATGTHMAGVASAAGRDRIIQMQRVQQMQSQSRADIYKTAQSAVGALAATIAQYADRLTQVSKQPLAPPVIENAQVHDPTTDTWVTISRIENKI